MRSFSAVLLVVLAVCWLLAPNSSCAESSVDRSYDTTYRVTYLSVPPFGTGPVSLVKPHSTPEPLPQMRFAAKFSCRGDVGSCRPRLVELRFISDATRWTLRDVPHSIRIGINGKDDLSWGEFAWSGAAISDNEYWETALLVVGVDYFEQMGKAKSVQIELNGMSFS